jgi:AcrR family transcriptional regulator
MSFSRQEEFLTKGRRSQKQRTRDVLIEAAGAMAREGRQLAIADVAEAAQVSTATAYRYFPNPRSLWVELGIRQAAAADPAKLATLPDDAEGRIDSIIRLNVGRQFDDEALWRAVMRATMDRWFAQAELPEEERMPIRSTARMDFTRTALQPLEGTLPPELLRRLTMAMNLVYGLEAMIVARDVCGLEQDEATEVMTWAAQALLQAARAEAAGS